MKNYPKQRILAKLDAQIEKLENSTKYCDQLSRNHCYQVREQMLELNQVQALKIERAVYAAENAPDPYGFGKVNVFPSDYLAFL